MSLSLRQEPYARRRGFFASGTSSVRKHWSSSLSLPGDDALFRSVQLYHVAGCRPLTRDRAKYLPPTLTVRVQVEQASCCELIGVTINTTSQGWLHSLQIATASG